MIKHYCDKCNKEVKHNTKKTEEKSYFVEIRLDGFSIYSRGRNELCYKCMLGVVGEKEFAEMVAKKEAARKAIQERKQTT